ncbi:hypothetical protein C8F01DRAFT_1154601 [Mycena amicta]|nr:hypothetical protein C8F01DRAFT_1154601 [Mycena amicta]
MAPGTNYMGGRRNAARAKSRDTVGRAQKHHFSRQRLDIISNGLGPGRRPPSVGKYQPTTAGFGLKATADIGLSHARRQVLGDIAIPFAPPQTPTHLTTAQTHAAHSSSGSRSSTSRVLEALNSSEPIAMRSVRNRILSMPDLAGLSTSFGNAVMPLQTPATKRRRSRSPSGSAESDSFVVEREERKHKVRFRFP